MTSTLYLTRGLPASGKTTWAEKWVAEAPAGRARVNRDDVRAMLFGRPVLEYSEEQAVTAAQHQAVRALLLAGRSVVVDDTNLRAKYTRAWADLAAEVGARLVTVDHFLEVPALECAARDAARPSPVGWQVIDRMTRYLGGITDVTPTPASERAAWTPPPYVADESLPIAYIVDLDGTLAMKAPDRGWYDFHLVAGDTVHEHVAHTVRAIHASEAVIVAMSGRSEDCREVTEAWLAAKGLPYDELHMRASGDGRDDALVKSDLFDKYVAHRYNVYAAIDDRDRVVGMWRAKGLPCFQVAPGDF